MKEYWHNDWKSKLHELSLFDFETIWSLDLQPIEPPNVGRGGESYVGKLMLPNSNQSIYIKHQENHQRRTISHPFQGKPTTAVEFGYLKQYHHLNIPSLLPLYAGQRTKNSNHEALLITLGLDEHVSLDNLYQQISQLPKTEFDNWHHFLLKHIAEILNRLHQAKIQHSALYPKHILVNQHYEKRDIRIIDLEKSRKRLLKHFCQRRDIDCLFRHADFWNIDDQQVFLSHYFKAKNSKQIESFSKKLQKYTKKKSKK